MERADLDLLVAGNINDVNMVEGEMKELSETEMVEAIKVAHEAIIAQCKAQLEFVEMLGGVTKQEYSHEVHDEDLRLKLKLKHMIKCYDIAAEGNPNKKVRAEAFKAIRKHLMKLFAKKN